MSFVGKANTEAWQNYRTGASLVAPKHFPSKLFEVLQTADESVISFQPHGRSFMIRDPARFVQEVLPGYARLDVAAILEIALRYLICELLLS
jgi:HSF-type DNA-binding